jgi:hypothetical protein
MVINKRELTMHYEFNISKNGHHLFATHERSIRDLDAARALNDILCKKFPAQEGYLIAVSEVSRSSCPVPADILSIKP